MGIVERKERQKAELREQILDAARAIVLAEGFDALSMRKIADAIEYSPATIYLHFASRDRSPIESRAISPSTATSEAEGAGCGAVMHPSNPASRRRSSSARSSRIASRSARNSGECSKSNMRSIGRAAKPPPKIGAAWPPDPPRARTRGPRCARRSPHAL